MVLSSVRHLVGPLTLAAILVGACISEPDPLETNSSELVAPVVEEDVDDIPLARLGVCRGYVTSMASRNERLEITGKPTSDGHYECTRFCPYNADSAPSCREGFHPKSDPCPDNFMVNGRIAMFIKADDAAAALAKCTTIWDTEYPKGCMERPEVGLDQVPEYDEFECVED